MAHISCIFCASWQVYNSWYLTSHQWRGRKLGLPSLVHIYSNESFKKIPLGTFCYCSRGWRLAQHHVVILCKNLDSFLGLVASKACSLFHFPHLANCLCSYLLIWAASRLTMLSHSFCSEKTYRAIFKEDIFTPHFFGISFL